MTPPQVADLLLAAPLRCGTTRLLCIDGPAGSGKTTLATALADELEATIVHMDDLYAGWTGLEAGVTQATRIVDALAARRPVTYAPWNWQRADRGDAVEVKNGPVVIVEGVGSVAGANRNRDALQVGMDTDDDVRRQRALARDRDAC